MLTETDRERERERERERAMLLLLNGRKIIRERENIQLCLCKGMAERKRQSAWKIGTTWEKEREMTRDR